MRLSSLKATLLASSLLFQLSLMTAHAEAPAALPAGSPFAAASSLPYAAPQFDRIKDTDYQPAIEAGMVQDTADNDAIANNPAAPTFDNTIIAMEKAGRLLNDANLQVRSVDSASLLAGHKTVQIAHNGSVYTLQATKLGKLILTK